MSFEHDDRIELVDGPGVFKVMSDANSPKTGLHWGKFKGSWEFVLKPPYDYVIVLMAAPDYRYPSVGQHNDVIALSIYKHQIQRIFKV